MGNTTDQPMDELSKLEERVSRLERWREDMPNGETMGAMGRMILELSLRNDGILDTIKAEEPREAELIDKLKEDVFGIKDKEDKS